MSEKPDIAPTVVWSGGADSTHVLLGLATVSSQSKPVRALTMDYHPQLHSIQQKSELAAQKRLMRFAKKRGYHIWWHRVQMKTSTDACGVSPTFGQHHLWSVQLSSYFYPGGEVYYGYIRRDDYWHYRHSIDRVLEAIAQSADTTFDVQYPLEWYEKTEVIRDLRAAGVPDDCWWTCESPKTVGEACGRCKKCKEVADAVAILEVEQQEIAARPTLTVTEPSKEVVDE